MANSFSGVRRRVKQMVAGTIFIGLLLGSTGTVFTVFAAAIDHIGRMSVAPVVTTSPSVNTNTAPPATTTNAQSDGGFTPPVVEYPNQSTNQGASQSTSQLSTVNPNADAAHSALASAMDTGGVYVGEHVQSVVGAMLKGVINTLFINSN